MNKDKKLFKNKIQMVIYLLLFALLLGGFIYFGNKDYSKKEETVTEEEKLIEFEDGNVYTKINASEAFNFIKRKDVIMLFGINNADTLEYGNIISEVAKEKGIDTIYYYDMEKDRKENNASYRSLVDYLSDYSTYLEGSNNELYAPSLIVKHDGNVIYYDNFLAVANGKTINDDIFSEENINIYKTTYGVVFDNYLGGISDGNGE